MRFKAYEVQGVRDACGACPLLDPQLPGCASRKVSGEVERPLRRAVGAVGCGGCGHAPLLGPLRSSCTCVNRSSLERGGRGPCLRIFVHAVCSRYLIRLWMRYLEGRGGPFFCTLIGRHVLAMMLLSKIDKAADNDFTLLYLSVNFMYCFFTTTITPVYILI